jgi:hypothetical protein
MVMKIVGAFALITMGIVQAGSQPANCAPSERRLAAIRYARVINTAEASAIASSRSYRPVADLQIPSLPDDYKVQLATDGTRYAFSIKDLTDACHGAVFSDQDGMIYTGAPLQ